MARDKANADRDTFNVVMENAATLEKSKPARDLLLKLVGRISPEYTPELSALLLNSTASPEERRAVETALSGEDKLPPSVYIHYDATSIPAQKMTDLVRKLRGHNFVAWADKYQPGERVPNQLMYFRRNTPEEANSVLKVIVDSLTIPRE
jgi:hypothetical protein